MKKWPLWCKLFHRKPTIIVGPHRWACGNCGKEWGDLSSYRHEDVVGIVVDEDQRFLKVVLK